MDEEKIKKPLLSYEQVEDIISRRISCEEEENLDERIARIEKAAEKLEEEYKEMQRYRQRRRRKKKKSSLGRWWMRLLQCFRR